MKSRPLTLSLAAAIIVLLHCPIKNAVAVAAISNAEWTELREAPIVPQFVSTARLGQFLLAVDAATKMSQTARQAAEALSARFADENSKSALDAKPALPDALADAHPGLWLAALSIGVIPQTLNARPSVRLTKHDAAVSAHVEPTKARKGAQTTQLSYREMQHAKSFGQTGPRAKRVAWTSYSARSN